MTLASSSVKVKMVAFVAVLALLQIIACERPAVALPSSSEALPASGLVSHVFKFVAPPGTKTVNLAGTFDDWNVHADLMSKASDGVTWSITLNLEPGIYQYKFVLDGNVWKIDPTAPVPATGPDSSGNSILTLVPDDFSQPAILNDGIITKSALLHNQNLPYLNFDRGKLQFQFRARPNDIAQISLVISQGVKVPMQFQSTDGIFATYAASVNWTPGTSLQYWFQLNDGSGNSNYGPRGLTASEEGNKFQISGNTFTPFEPPKWVAKSIIYQIFPDRFSDGDASNDDPGTPSWGSVTNKQGWMGGDLKGVQQHEDYLKKLGISCIYFNPVFQTTTYHGYETSDYFKIDPHFGTNVQFDEMSKTFADDGIRIVLDGVFNHTSVKLKQFDDVVKNGTASKYVNWYTFHGFPVVQKPKPNYEAWFGYPSLPKLNNSNPEVRKFLLSIPTYWQSHASISGWRLDAANEIPFDYWTLFRKTVKGIDPNTWIVGEFWGNASQWLQGNAWDSVMNYPFMFAVWKFVGTDGDGNASELANSLMSNYNNYAPQVSRNLMNLIDSHDTIRILTECGSNSKLRDLASIIEFGWPGVPTIYNGDELGMVGGKDPDNRNPLRWDLATDSNPTLEFYRRLTKIRNASPELQEGDPKILTTNKLDQTFAFCRTLNNQMALCAVNRSNNSHTLDLKLGIEFANKTFIDGVTGSVFKTDTDGNLSIGLQAMQGMLLVPAREGQSFMLLHPLTSHQIIVG